ncbi:MAG TPA: multicopper oxidase domain-containing protein [Vicinamibacterales bacterium]|nr:multicopper oxidase domain-containing protein [Vicinamibacterales bacterium]
MASRLGGEGMAVESRRLRVVSAVAVEGRDEAALLALAGSVAGGLDPQVAAAILESARERDIQVREADRFRDIAHVGVSADVAGKTVVLGDAARLAGLGVSVEGFGDLPERLRRRGEHVLFLAVNGRAAGFFGLAPSSHGNTRQEVMEDQMNASLPAADRFPTLTEGLPAALATDVVALADGDRFDLRIAPVSKRLGGTEVRMLAYNGSVPGPTLRVQQGSQLVVNVVNDGDLDATVHWHGLRLENRFDGTTETQPPIPVGGTFTYRLTFPDPGIYWYHPHIREDYGQEMGLYGTVVVVPSEPDYWPAVNRELSLTLDDILLEHGAVAPFSRTHPTYTAMGRFGNVLLVNGEPEPSLRAKQGEVVRLYLTNTANTRVFNVGVAGARMKLVGGDSGRCERETFVDGVLIAPSERAVADVLFGQPGQVRLEHRTPDRTYELGTITVEAEPAEPSLASTFGILRANSDLIAERGRVAGYLDAAPDEILALVAEMDMGERQAPPGAAVEYVCPMHPEITSKQPGRCPKCGMKLVPADLVGAASHGEHEHADTGLDRHDDHQHDHEARNDNWPAGIEWEDDMVDVNRMTNPANMRWKLIDRQTGAEGRSIDWRFHAGDQVKIRLVNEMDSDHPMPHPFHVHGAGRFLILSRDGVVEPNLVWKDTVLVPTGQTVDILLEVTHPGVWMAHCHIAEHHESGMMLRFQVDPARNES